jgi:hypothetical protein
MIIQKSTSQKCVSRLQRKVEKFRNHAICLQHARTYCLILVNSKEIPHTVVTTCCSFSQKKHLYMLQGLLFFSVARMQNFTKNWCDS